MFTNHMYLIYMNKTDLALINLECLICHKIKLYPNQTGTVVRGGGSESPSLQRCSRRILEPRTTELR